MTKTLKIIRQTTQQGLLKKIAKPSKIQTSKASWSESSPMLGLNQLNERIAEINRNMALVC